jgi:hypothetical protein
MPPRERRKGEPVSRAREDSPLMDGSRRVNGPRREFRAINRRVRDSIRPREGVAGGKEEATGAPFLGR